MSDSIFVLLKRVIQQMLYHKGGLVSILFANSYSEA